MEELERHPPPAQRLVDGREEDVAHARRRLPEDGAAVLEEHLRREEDRGARTHAVVGAIFEVGEDEVVEPPDERELGHLLGRAVAGDPVEEVLVVERAEAAPVGDQPVGEHPAHGRRHDRDEVPGPAQIGIVVDQLVKRIVSGCERAVERLHR